MITSTTINEVILMGRLTADPELKQTQGGASVCQFTLAVNRQPDKSGEKKADFINVVAWSKTAEFISRYFTKGRLMIVNGSIRTRNYDDKNGIKHYVTEVFADNVAFGDSKSGNSNSGNYQQTAPNSGNYQQTANNNRNYQKTPTNNSLPNEFNDFEEVISDGGLPF